MCSELKKLKKHIRMEQYTLPELKDIYEQLISSRIPVPFSKEPHSESEYIDFIQQAAQLEQMKKNNTEAIAVDNFQLSSWLVNKPLTMSQVIDWMNTSFKSVKEEDYSIMVLYTYLWDRHLNAAARNQT